MSEGAKRVLYHGPSAEHFDGFARSVVGAAGSGGALGEGASESNGPRIGDRVRIGAGAIVLGPIHVGHDAVIGAGAVVVHDVPAGATVVGNPARVVATGTGS